jgi:predicted nuclease with TOPRIM domain
MAKKDRSESLRNQIEELREEAAALADRAKRTARQAEDLAERIKLIEGQLAKPKSWQRTIRTPSQKTPC